MQSLHMLGIPVSLSESSSERLLPVRPCRCGGRGRQNVLHAPVAEDALLGLGCRVTGLGILDFGFWDSGFRA